MMHDREKSDLSIVATKPANSGWVTAGELVERRDRAKGNTRQTDTLRTQRRDGVRAGLERVRPAAQALAVTDPRWEPYAGNPLVRFCAGGAQQ